VQLISRKLIAPAMGAIVVACVVGLATVTATGRPVSRSAPAQGSASNRAVRHAAASVSALAYGLLTAATLPPLPAAGDPVLSSRLRAGDVLAGHSITLAGTLAPALAGEHLTLQQRTGRGWRRIRARAGIRPTGGFRIRFRVRRLGLHVLRVELTGPDGTVFTPPTRLRVFQRVLVSWYDLTGRTACGSELYPSTRGVASLTLPCGTIVTFHFRRRTVRLRVIDRGPYVTGRAFDLTYAAKLALGAGDLTEVWADKR
jgi:rare lipoprotein A